MDHTRFAIVPLCAATSAALLVGGCSTKAPDQPENPQVPAYVVGLGEIMGLNQMRHAKLWFAGRAGNWPLAAYEIDELREGFTDAELYHEHHKSVPEPLTQMIHEYVDRPLDDLDTAIARKDSDGFVTAYDALTKGCNGCHQAANFGFNTITRPSTPPFSNQSFEPARDKSDAK